MHELLNALVTPQMNSLLPALSRAIDSGEVHAHLRQLLDIAPSESIPVTGYLHPNGFLKVRLAAQPDRWTLRFHIWNDSCAEADIHSHQWNFASKLLSGRMLMRTYLAPADPAGEWLRLHCRRTVQRGYEFRSIGRCNIVQQRETEYGCGDAYVQDHRWLHTLETSPSLPLVTLVLQGHDVRKWSSVIAAGGEEPPRQVPIRALEEAEIEKALRLASILLPD